MEGHVKKYAIFAVVLLLIITSFTSVTYANSDKIKTIKIHNTSSSSSDITDYEYVIITSNDLKYSNYYC